MVAGDRRSAFQKVFDGVAMLEVIEKHLDRYARTGTAVRTDPNDLA